MVDAWGVFGRRCVSRGPGASPPPPAVAISEHTVLLTWPRAALLQVSQVRLLVAEGGGAQLVSWFRF